MTDSKGIAKTTRFYRKIHKWIGTFLFVFFFTISVTGLLLGWKKHSGGLILPENEKGISIDLKTWLSYDSLHTIAVPDAKTPIE